MRAQTLSTYYSSPLLGLPAVAVVVVVVAVVVLPVAVFLVVFLLQ